MIRETTAELTRPVNTVAFLDRPDVPCPSCSDPWSRAEPAGRFDSGVASFLDGEPTPSGSRASSRARVDEQAPTGRSSVASFLDGEPATGAATDGWLDGPTRSIATPPTASAANGLEGGFYQPEVEGRCAVAFRMPPPNDLLAKHRACFVHTVVGDGGGTNPLDYRPNDTGIYCTAVTRPCVQQKSAKEWLLELQASLDVVASAPTIEYDDVLQIPLYAPAPGSSAVRTTKIVWSGRELTPSWNEATVTSQVQGLGFEPDRVSLAEKFRLSEAPRCAKESNLLRLAWAYLALNTEIAQYVTCEMISKAWTESAHGMQEAQGLLLDYARPYVDTLRAFLDPGSPNRIALMVGQLPSATFPGSPLAGDHQPVAAAEPLTGADGTANGLINIGSDDVGWWYHCVNEFAKVVPSAGTDIEALSNEARQNALCILALVAATLLHELAHICRIPPAPYLTGASIDEDVRATDSSTPGGSTPCSVNNLVMDAFLDLVGQNTPTLTESPYCLSKTDVWNPSFGTVGQSLSLPQQSAHKLSEVKESRSPCVEALSLP